MGLLGAVVSGVKTVVVAVTDLISPLVGPLANVLGTAGSAATGIAGYLISAVSGTGYAAFPLIGVVTSFIGATIELTGTTPPSIPFPNPIVKVETYSGSVHRTSYVPIGGVPVSIDVDNGMVLGALAPDVAVSVGLISPNPDGQNLANTLIQPWIKIQREILAAKSGHIAPQLNISTEIQLKDAFNGFKEFATIDYGYDTPDGGRIPPLVLATITGPISGAFVDPLKAKLEAPGYDAPLKFNITASTPSLLANFGIKFNPMPHVVNLVEDPRPDGLDAHYDDQGPIPDVKMDADISMLNRTDNSLLKIGASIERLPYYIDLHDTNTTSRTFIDYQSVSVVKPADLRATYQQFAPNNGPIVTDADIRVASLPNHMTGEIKTVPNPAPQTGAALDSVNFQVLDGQDIGSVDFLVKNYLGDPGPIPELNLGPQQFVTLASRRLADQSTRYRAAGRIEHIRSATFSRTGATKKGYDVTTDIGSGTKQLRAVMDMDDRGPGAPPDAQRFKLDARIVPLPRTIHAVFLPGADKTQPTNITYDSPQIVDATADVLIARGATDGCGQIKVTCANAQIDKVSKHLALTLPGDGGTDYAVSDHNDPGDSPSHPDIHAVVDNTPDIASDRLWAQIELLRVPSEIRARIDTSPEKVLRTAEFHACAWDYASAACTSPQDALGRVRFTVRNSPTRDATLPRRPDQSATFVSMIKRPTGYEIQGRVDEIRNVRFRQRDLNHDGQPDGTLGVLVDAGVGGPFDAHIDQLGPDQTRPDPKPDASSIIDAHVASLPTLFTACYREANVNAPAAIGTSDADPLLAPCDRQDLLGRSAGGLTRTPLSIQYDASQPTAVTATLQSRAVDVNDLDGTSAHNPIEHTRKITVNVDQVPAHMRADVLLPVDDNNDASKARPLEARYESNAAINNVDLTMDDHRSNGTASPDGNYIEAHVAGVPTRVSAKIDTARKVLKRADFHACDYNYTTEACGDAQQTLGSVDFLVRPQRRRGALPAVPGGHAANFVSLIKRLNNSEITGHVGAIRNVSFRQRDDDGSGKADGTLGVSVDAGSGGPFDAHVDQVAPDDNYPAGPTQPTALSVLDAHVATLSSLFSACFRSSADAAPPSPGSLSANSLLAPCDSNDVLGHHPATSTALTSTPLTIDYKSFAPTLITATVHGEAENKDDHDKLHTSDMSVTIDKVPATLHADLIPGRDVVPATGSTPELAARALEFAYKASAPIASLTLGLENKRTDETPSDSDLFATANVTGIPSALSGQMDTEHKVLRRAEFHACSFDFVTRACTDAQQAIDNVQFTVRPSRRRGELPPSVQPASPTADFVSLVKRFDNSEITGQVHSIRNVAFHQRDDNNDGKPDGTLGVQVDAGTNASFDAHIDQLANDLRPDVPGFSALTPIPTASTVVDAHIDHLPLTFSACLRSPHEGAQGAVSADPLLSDCDTSPVTTQSPEPPATPMTLVYNASSPTHINATVNSRGLDIEDLPDPTQPFSNSNKPFDHTSKLTADVSAVPTFMRADVMPSLTTDASHPDSRHLQVVYDSSTPIAQVLFGTENRRTSSLCLDPRSGRQATCFSARVVNIPTHLDVSFDPDQSKGALAINSGAPTTGPLSIHDIVYQATSPDSKGHPLSATADLTNIPQHITGRIAQYDPPLPAKKDLGVVRFNACPPPGPTLCPGIGNITFTATNSLIDSALPGVPSSPEAGVTQHFTMVQRGDDFRAEGSIDNLREVGLSRLTPADDLANAAVTNASVTATKHIRAAFGGAGEKLRAYLDTDDGANSLKLDAIVSDAPNAINVCLRDATDVISPAQGDPYLPAGDFCDTAPKNQFAISAGLDTASPTVKPDINIYTLRQANASGSSILTGSAKIDDLGARINATVDKGKRGGILVEGRDLSNNLADVAGRVSFDLRNFDASPGTAFPYGPLGDNTDPSDDTRNDDVGSPPNAGRNYVTVGQDGKFLRLRGSIPDIKRVGLAPGACDPTDPRFPLETNAAWGAGRAPSYTCIRAALGAGRPLGFAVRQRTTDPVLGTNVLALEEGHINSVPTAGDGLSATVSSVPEPDTNLPACSTKEDPPVETTAIPCKPELLAVQTSPAAGTPPELEARAFMGPEALVDQLGTTPVADAVGSRLDYNTHPRDFGDDGIRVRVGTKKTLLPFPNDSQTAVRVGLRIPIPHWLDIDTPTFYSCARKSVSQPCANTPDSQPTDADNERTSASDIFVRFIAADDARFGGTACSGAGCYLGKVAVAAHDFDKNTDTIITGAPPANQPNGTSNATPEDPPGPGDYDNGFDLPRHLDARVQMRENHTGSDDKLGTTYIQADMRLNAPISLMARLAPKPENIDRDGNTVPSLTAIVRNLNGLGPGAPNFDNPTQRARVVMKDKKTTPGFFKCGGDGLGVDFRFLGFGLTGCLITPSPATRWVNLDLNAAPNSSSPARDISAVVDTTDNNEVELKGYTSDADSSAAQFGVTAGLRLEPFDLGARLGGGIGIVGGTAELDLDGDLIVGTHNNPSSRLRLSNNAGAIRLATADGGSNVDVDLREGVRAKIVGEALFGLVKVTLLDVSTPRVPVPVEFGHCDTGGFFGSVNHFETTDSTKAGLTLGVGFPSAVLSSGPLSLLLTALPPAFCAFFSTSDAALASPAPGYLEPGRPVIDTAPVAATPPPPPPADVSPDPQDLTVSGGTLTRCGVLTVKGLHVTSTGTLQAGLPGTNDSLGNACDGRLTITADTVVVDNGGVITADARMTGGHGATATAGPGAGHAGAGGGTPGFLGGGTYDDGDDNDAGSGATGGGLGGGVIAITATRSIDNSGRITANGANGASATSGCAGAAGGGSGGRVRLTASRVAVTSTGVVSADGGSGGAGGTGGGAGGGGRVRIDRIALQAGAVPSTRIHALGNTGGAAGSGCGAGGNSGGGNATLGDVIDRGAGVTVTNANSNDFVRGTANLHISAVDPNGNDVEIIVCRRSVPTTDPDGFNADALNPTGTTISSRLGTDTCTDEQFAAPTSNGVEYDRDITVSGLGNAFYGFYAIVAHQNFALFGNCATFTAFCTYQSTLPPAAQTRFASDNVAPTADVTQPLEPKSGTTTNCPDGRFCQPTSVGLAQIVPTDDFSGVDQSACRVNGVPADGFPINPCRGSSAQIQLGGDGAKDVHVQFTDRAGNVATFDDKLKYFVDSTKPDPPAILMIYSDAAINGWHRTKPDVSVIDGDHNPSAGWKHDPIQFFVDGGGSDCGGDPAVDALAICSVSDLASKIPDEGTHHFDALATDILGNQSLRSDNPDIDTDDVVEKVDHTKPTSKLYLGPNTPDGAAGWYQTNPIIAFAASDTPGGAGVDLTGAINPSGVFFSLDGNPTFTKFDPAFTVAGDQTVPDGVHNLCWYSVDEAGNQEATQCQNNIKVDNTSPAPSATVTPNSPDGSNGWDVTSPHFSLSGGDTGSGINTGLNPDSDIFVSIDGARFSHYNGALPNNIGDGDHELCWYAVDVAGNLGGSGTPGTASCRRLKVDTTAPPTVVPYLDPASPDGISGWYQSKPFVDFAQRDQDGGSGGEASGTAAPSGTRFSVDGGPFIQWDPANDVQNKLGDGTHTLCWRGFDIAGNAATPNAGCQQVKVDSIAPVATAPILPPAPDGNNSYYVTQPKISPAGTDAGGSGLDRVEASVDGADWVTAASVVIPEGEHNVRVRAVDKAGNFSPIVEQTVRYDGSDPGAFPGTFPPFPNDQGWFRQPVHESIAVEDGRASSGEDGATYQIDGGSQVSYLAPFDIGEGNHVLTVRPRDRAGRIGAPVPLAVKVDLTAPVPQPIPLPGGQPWTILLPFQTTTLKFTVSDNLSTKVRVRVELIDELGNVVQELAVPGDAQGFIPTGAGTVIWNGSLANGKKATPGLYHYRVEATDQAGNTAQSTEGANMILALGAGTL